MGACGNRGETIIANCRNARPCIYRVQRFQKKNPIYIWRGLGNAEDPVVPLQEFLVPSGCLGWKSKNKNPPSLCPLTIPWLRSSTRYKRGPELWKKIGATGSDGESRPKEGTKRTKAVVLHA